MEEAICATLRVIKEGPPPKIFIWSGLDVYYIMKFLENEDREKFYVLHLDASNGVIAKECVGIGTLTHSLAHPREIFKAAIMNNSASIVLVHNHPSGNTNPSHEDLLITERLSQAGSLLGINVYDHIIIGYGIYHSIKFDSNKPSILTKKSEPQKVNKEVKIADKKTIDDIEKLRKLLDLCPGKKPSVIKILEARETIRKELESLTDLAISFLKQSITHPKGIRRKNYEREG